MANLTALKRLCPVHGDKASFGCAECARIALDPPPEALTSNPKVRYFTHPDTGEYLVDRRRAVETSGELEQWKQAVSRMRGAAATCLAVKPTSGMMRHTLEKLAGYDMVTCEHCGAETSWSDVPCESCGQLPVKSNGDQS